MKQRKPWFTVVFAAVLGIACATLLTAAQELTRGPRQENRRAERIRHVLEALGLEVPPGADNAAVFALYEEHVRPDDAETPSRHTRVGPDGRPVATAYRFEGTGLWGPIRGYVALWADGERIRSVSFYEQSETPGLGGDIVKADFRRQFEGKVIPLREGRPDLQVDAISGATMTSRRVEGMLNRALARILEEAEADE